MKHYNQYGQEVFNKKDQAQLDRIRQKLRLAEIRLDKAVAGGHLLLARSIETHIAFLIRQESSYYKGN